MSSPHPIIPWLPLIGPILGAAVAVLGWYAAYRLGVRKDLSLRRRELRVQYLIDAYRRLESASQREPAERMKELESAIADIYLFGSGRQIGVLRNLLQGMPAEGFTSFDDVLQVLRAELRQELGMPPDTWTVGTFRLPGLSAKHPPAENAL